MKMIATADALRDELTPLIVRWSGLFAAPTNVWHQIDVWASELHHGNLAYADAQALVHAIYDQQRPTWWQTPIGQLLFGAGGFPTGTLPTWRRRLSSTSPGSDSGNYCTPNQPPGRR